MNPVVTAARAPRAPHTAKTATTQERGQAFDADIEERAETLRESAALQELLLEQLKNEDEILKKWIALI